MSAAVGPMTFDELSELYRVEMKSASLTQPRKDLFRAMANLLLTLRKEYDRQMSLDPDSVMTEGAEQRRKNDPPDRGFRPAQPQRQHHHHAVQQSIQQENPSRFHGDIIAARPFFSCRLHTRKTMNLRAHSTHLSIFDINQLRLIRFSLSKNSISKNARSPP